MDLKHAIIDLKYVDRFLKSLSKVIGTMEVVENLERRESEVKGRIEILESRKQVAVSETVMADETLAAKKLSVNQEKARINADISKEKGDLIRDFDSKIADRKEQMLLLDKCKGDVALENKGLEKVKSELKVEINNLKKVVDNTGKLINSVES